MLPYAPVTLVALFRVHVPCAFGILSSSSAKASSFFLFFAFSSPVSVSLTSSSVSLSLSLLWLSSSLLLVSESSSLPQGNSVRNERRDKKLEHNSERGEGKLRIANRCLETSSALPASPHNNGNVWRKRCSRKAAAAKNICLKGSPFAAGGGHSVTLSSFHLGYDGNRRMGPLRRAEPKKTACARNEECKTRGQKGLSVGGHGELETGNVSNTNV